MIRVLPARQQQVELRTGAGSDGVAEDERTVKWFVFLLNNARVAFARFVVTVLYFWWNTGRITRIRIGEYPSFLRPVIRLGLQTGIVGVGVGTHAFAPFPRTDRYNVDSPRQKVSRRVAKQAVVGVGLGVVGPVQQRVGCTVVAPAVALQKVGRVKASVGFTGHVDRLFDAPVKKLNRGRVDRRRSESGLLQFGRRDPVDSRLSNWNLQVRLLVVDPLIAQRLELRPQWRTEKECQQENAGISTGHTAGYQFVKIQQSVLTTPHVSFRGRWSLP